MSDTADNPKNPAVHLDMMFAWKRINELLVELSSEQRKRIIKALVVSYD